MTTTEQSFEILNSFFDSIAIINANGEIVFINSAWKKFSMENSGGLDKTGPGINYPELCKKVISIDSNDHEADISIKDNGIGISKGDIPKIFDLNFQVNKNLFGGHGVGLNLVKKSIEFVAGKMNVNSEPGKGKEFRFIIPNQNN
jgi:nitrogen-specific signal transduction histidine kinase